VSGDYTNKDLWQTQIKVMWEDPICYRNCVLLSHNVFDDWFTIKKMGEDDELVEHDENEQIQEEFERMRAKYHFTQALMYERGLGRSFLVYDFNLHKDDIEGEGYQIATLDVFTEENTVIPSQAYDPVTGEPEYIVVRPNASNKTYEERIPWSELQLWCTRPKGRSYEGYIANSASWDNMTYMRESVDAIAWAIKKFGVGVLKWVVKGALSTELKDAIEDTLQNISARRAVVQETDKVEKIEWVGPQGSSITTSTDFFEFLLGEISSATGIPKDVYTGVSAGAITGSEINNKALYATISKIQSDITPYVLNTIERMGYDIDGMIIEWNTRYATDELEQAQIRLLEAQAAQLEAQAEQGFGPNDIMVRAESQKDQQQNNNPGGVQS